MASKPSLQFIDVFLIAMIFFGISEATTSFFFPFGKDVFRLINFYLVVIIALMTLIKFRNKQAEEISFLNVALDFAIFLVPSYLVMMFLFQGSTQTIPIPKSAVLISEIIVSFSENYIAFILFPAVIGMGNGGSLNPQTTLLKLGNFSFGYRIPSLSRIERGLPSLALITLLHVGAYANKVATLNEFYISLVIAFSAFLVFLIFKETFGFGSSEALHASWNSALLTFRGQII